MIETKIFRYGDYLIALSDAVIEKRPFSWLKEFNFYFNGKEWVKK